jgi:hypothetical protein
MPIAVAAPPNIKRSSIAAVALHMRRHETIGAARFLGYDGWFAEQGETVLTRPPDVVLDSAGPLEARVAGAVALKDGFRLELELSNGRLFTVAALPAPRVGDMVRVRVDGRVRFPAAQVPLDDFAMLKT